MTKDIGSKVANQVAELIKKEKGIPFGIDIPDKQYSEIRWSQYGLIETNEIAVVVRCGNKAFAARAGSNLVMPAMADRVWGMDVLDEELAFKLGDKLWGSFSEELIREAKLRQKNIKRKKGGFNEPQSRLGRSDRTMGYNFCNLHNLSLRKHSA